jgi:hypothetical protein
MRLLIRPQNALFVFKKKSVLIRFSGMQEDLVKPTLFLQLLEELGMCVEHSVIPQYPVRDIGKNLPHRSVVYEGS